MNKNYPNHNTNSQENGNLGVPNNPEKSAVVYMSEQKQNGHHTRAVKTAKKKSDAVTVILVCLCILLTVVLALAILFLFPKKNDVEKEAIQKVARETPQNTPIPPAVREEKINVIQKRYYDLQDNITACKTEWVDNMKKYFSPEGTLVRVDVSLANGGEIYYYDNGSLYFVFEFLGEKEQRFYYDNGRLLRWIVSEEGAPEQIFDTAEENTEFEKYEKKWLVAENTHAAKVKYRVRTSYADVKGQIGAYEHLEPAKKKADENPGFKVYNMYGTLIYDPTEN